MIWKRIISPDFVLHQAEIGETFYLLCEHFNVADIMGKALSIGSA